MAIERLVIASGNRDKLKEIRNFFASSGFEFEIASIAEWDENFDPEENGASLADNALIKAQAAAVLCNLPVLADDTGLKVKALYGAPGIHSARYAGVGATYEQNCDKLLKTMKGYRDSDRAAQFVCHVTLLLPNGEQLDVDGIIEGSITNKMTGAEGFGYDPLFFLPEQEKTLAELSIEEKNAISHRAKALEAMVKEMTSKGLI
jgi:XTP/dITP diphosphohydrolase